MTASAPHTRPQVTEPPSDAGVPEVVGALHERRGELLGGERGGPDFCHACHQVEGWGEFGTQGPATTQALPPWSRGSAQPRDPARLTEVPRLSPGMAP